MTRDIALRRRWPELCALVLCLAFAVAPVAVSAQSSPFVVDVWTSRGGQGVGVVGGSFGPGDDIIIYLSATQDCYVSIGLGKGDGGTLAALDNWQLAGGQTVTLPAIPLDAADNPFGTWWVEADAVSISGSVLSSDYVMFSVSPEAPPASTPFPAPTPPNAAAVTAEDATALDALIALKMAEGSLPAEVQFDVNGDGRVTLDDARAILKWAVQ